MALVTEDQVELQRIEAKIKESLSLASPVQLLRLRSSAALGEPLHIVGLSLLILVRQLYTSSRERN